MVCKNIRRIVRFITQRSSEPYLRFRRVLGFYPCDLRLYELAVQHSSLSRNTANSESENNERLEFLGDSIIGAVVADYLYSRFGDQREGYLTNVRSRIVSREMMNSLAEKIGLRGLVQVSDSLGRDYSGNILGNALEALVGAIYLDQGFARAKQFVLNRLISGLPELDNLIVEDLNYKSRLIEYCQKYKKKFEFVLVEEQHFDDSTHSFRTAFKLDGEIIAEAEGNTKKESHQQVARLVLDYLGD